MLDLETKIYTQIWALLNDPTNGISTLVDPANQIRYDQISGMQIADKKTTADSDYPQAELLIRSGSTDLYTGTETFDTYSEDDSGNIIPPQQPWLETHTYIYRLRLKSDIQPIQTPDVLGSTARTALRAGGPRLGLKEITRVRLAWTLRETDRDENDSTRRWVTVIDVTVQCQIQSTDL